MDGDDGAFTADDFRARAQRRALSLIDIASVAPVETALRGDHDADGSGLDAQGGLIMDVAPDSYRLAAVLIGVVAHPAEATILLTVRAKHLPSHAGQIAFPGGKMETGDATIIDTALREAQEEIGLPPSLVTPIARLDTYLTGTGFRIVPVLGVVEPGFVLSPDPTEVAETFEVPLQFLMTVANHQRHSMEWQGRKRFFYAMPYGERYIWGATAGILRIMYERLYAA